MNRLVNRDRKLPAFDMDVGDLEALWERLLALFSKPEECLRSFSVSKPGEKLNFDDVTEARESGVLTGQVREFHIYLAGGGRSLHLRVRNGTWLTSYVSATGESEAWCAGAIETVISYFRSYRPWHYWTRAASFGWIATVVVLGPTIASASIPKWLSASTMLTLGVTVSVVSILAIASNRLFPRSVLHFSREEGPLRRHAPVLSLALALLSVLIAAYSAFWPRPPL